MTFLISRWYCSGHRSLGTNRPRCDAYSSRHALFLWGFSGCKI